MPNLTRRRFIAVSAAAGLAPGIATAREVATWRGIALGARAEIRISGTTQAAAAPVLGAIIDEISRLEDVFSLYRPNSVISQLNLRGELDAPPAELLQVFSIASALHYATDRAFDPTIQTFWTLAAAAAQRNTWPVSAEIAEAQRRVNWEAVRFDSGRVAFARPGMSITLNGIAQGFITDRIADKLRAFGLRDVLVDMGELRAIGVGPSGAPWHAAIADPDGGPPIKRVVLRERALATSAPHGTILDRSGSVGHIFDPRTCRPALGVKQVSVSAPTAAVADGLSTAFCLLKPSQITSALRNFDGAKLEDMVI
ncbi:MAG: FAD:protein FMN transferase [Boseongicola sp.]